MPKTKAQGILFGLIMSYSMAIGMEIYNTASALGFAQQPGGLSNLRSAVFLPCAARDALHGADRLYRLEPLGKPHRRENRGGAV